MSFVRQHGKSEFKSNPIFLSQEQRCSGTSYKGSLEKSGSMCNEVLVVASKEAVYLLFLIAA